MSLSISVHLKHLHAVSLPHVFQGNLLLISECISLHGVLLSHRLGVQIRIDATHLHSLLLSHPGLLLLPFGQTGKVRSLTKEAEVWLVAYDDWHWC